MRMCRLRKLDCNWEMLQQHVVGAKQITTKVHILSFQKFCIYLILHLLIEWTGLFKDRLYFKIGAILI